MTIRNRDFLFRPRSIALVGASDREHSIGSAVMRNLLKGKFPGRIFPVHSTRRSVAGVHAYREVGYLPQAPDLAIICTPPDTVPGLVHSLGTHGTRAAAILTDGVEHEAVLVAEAGCASAAFNSSTSVRAAALQARGTVPVSWPGASGPPWPDWSRCSGPLPSRAVTCTPGRPAPGIS